ncbi:MAG: hypothetical protein HRT45_08330, partial [Bdellovibrionales bacterium]|nr:hypothetical protein [Bdellovibrionales bacterium]
MTEIKNDFKISVIVPTCREGKASCVKEMTQSYPESNQIEKIIVDANTAPAHLKIWRAAGWRV